LFWFPNLTYYCQNFQVKKNLLAFMMAFIWLSICTYLLTMPGSKIPKESWLDKIGIDKVVHIVMFSILTFLWCGAVIKKTKNVFLIIAGFCLAYGIAMEFVQRDLVANRGFDVWDIVADAAGCILGYYVSSRRYIKK
jgi:VanZ family protein